jgi:predicted NBD/HSP70 family sugar kinase
MYVAIDIGGTKTLVCVLTNEGVIREEVKFPTPHTYSVWLKQLEETLNGFEHTSFKAGGVAAPGIINRQKQVVEAFSNLPWKNVALTHDVAKITKCPMVMENDAKLAGLSEAMLVKDTYKRVLYITLSTGIGLGLVQDGRIDTNVGEGGGKSMMIAHDDKLIPWETFASGSAIVKKYGKMASEIDDASTWKAIVRNLVPGFLELIAILEPQVIIVGGGAGRYLPKFHDFLVSDLKKYETPLLEIPPIQVAERPDEAVIYGCYDYAKQHFA